MLDEKYKPPYACDYPAAEPFERGLPIEFIDKDTWQNRESAERRKYKILMDPDDLLSPKNLAELMQKMKTPMTKDDPDFLQGVELLQTPAFEEIAEMIRIFGWQCRRLQGLN